MVNSKHWKKIMKPVYHIRLGEPCPYCLKPVLADPSNRGRVMCSSGMRFKRRRD